MFCTSICFCICKNIYLYKTYSFAYAKYIVLHAATGLTLRSFKHKKRKVSIYCTCSFIIKLFVCVVVLDRLFVCFSYILGEHKTPELTKIFLQEIFVMQQMEPHPNIVTLLGYCTDLDVGN